MASAISTITDPVYDFIDIKFDMGASVEQSVASVTERSGAKTLLFISGFIEVIFKSLVILRVAFRVSAKYTVRMYP